jgi:ribonuclease VapC
VIVVDSSAIVAILLQEPDAAKVSNAIERAAQSVMAAPNMLETHMVILSRRGEPGVLELDALMNDSNIEIVPFDQEGLEIARQAFRAYGKGRHKAGLNFGDCIAYATAKLRDAPLLAKGGDFLHTDVLLAD